MEKIALLFVAQTKKHFFWTDLLSGNMLVTCEACKSQVNINHPALLAGSYKIHGIVATLESNDCDSLCRDGTHGTTALFVLAKSGLVKQTQKFSYNRGCSDKTPPNKEKGEVEKEEGSSGVAVAVGIWW